MNFVPTAIRGAGSITDKLFGLLLLLATGMTHATEVVTFTGAEDYQQLCAACHGPTGQGEGPVAQVLSKPVPDLTGIRTRNAGVFPREELIRQIDGRDRIDAHGSQQMPVWGYEFWIDAGTGQFSEAQVTERLTALVDYLESIQLTP
ncbi:MAG: c-type cytochrome [Gammaproteobacteria bacterium]